MDQQIEGISTSGNTLSVTVCESLNYRTTDLCLRVKDREEFEKLKKMMNHALTLNTVLVLDIDGKREIYNLEFDGLPL